MATGTPVRERLVRPGQPPRRPGNRAAASRRFGYLLVAPGVVLLLAVTAYPLINTDFGAGGAISILLVIIALVISAGYVRFLRPQT